MARKSFKSGALLAPLPAVLVTVGDMNEYNMLTVAWTGILSTDPPRAYISVRKSRHSYEMIKKSGEFVINLTTESLALATDYAGIYTGAKVNKFKETALTPIESECVGAPTIRESPLSLECMVFDVMESGTHDVFMADIVNVTADDSIIDEGGRLCFDRAGLITYAHGEYFALGKRLGKFGYSTDKKNKDKIKYSEEKKNSSQTRKTGKEAPRHSGNYKKKRPKNRGEKK